MSPGLMNARQVEGLASTLGVLRTIAKKQRRSSGYHIVAGGEQQQEQRRASGHQIVAGGENQEEQLQQGLLRASLFPVTVQSVKVREAGPLLQLLGLQLVGAEVPRRIICNGQPLSKMADVCDILLLLQDPLLPLLHRSPIDPFLLAVLERCAVKLKQEAEAAGGSLHDNVRVVGQRMACYAIDARAHPRFTSFAQLQGDIDRLLRDINRLLDTSCTVYIPSPTERAQLVGAKGAEVAGAEAGAEVTGAEAGAETAQVTGADVVGAEAAQIVGAKGAQIAGAEAEQVTGAEGADVFEAKAAQVDGAEGADVVGHKAAHV